MKHILKLIPILCFAFAISACNKDDDFTYSTLTVEIDSEPHNCLNESTGEMEPGMWVKEEGKDKWEGWLQTIINGYTFEEGYYTKAEITRKTEKTPHGVLGGNPNSYRLIRIIDKHKSESVRTK
ncbi:MAG: DUF4377 domain-containing protein [Bacteroidales bacterium]|nr:DUF4377 domain-containing protein [Bacteroidales bacterium]